jgi:hypothetical protein
MLMIQIRIRLSLDLFGQIRILQGAMAVRCAIFHAHSQIGIRVVANTPDLRSLILHLRMHCSTGCSFEKVDFKPKHGLAKLGLGLIYYPIASSQPPSHYTVPLT